MALSEVKKRGVPSVFRGKRGRKGLRMGREAAEEWGDVVGEVEEKNTGGRNFSLLSHGDLCMLRGS